MDQHAANQERSPLLNADSRAAVAPTHQATGATYEHETAATDEAPKYTSGYHAQESFGEPNHAQPQGQYSQYQGQYQPRRAQNPYQAQYPYHPQGSGAQGPYEYGEPGQSYGQPGQQPGHLEETPGERRIRWDLAHLNRVILLLIPLSVLFGVCGFSDNIVTATYICRPSPYTTQCLAYASVVCGVNNDDCIAAGMTFATAGVWSETAIAVGGNTPTAISVSGTCAQSLVQSTIKLAGLSLSVCDGMRWLSVLSVGAAIIAVLCELLLRAAVRENSARMYKSIDGYQWCLCVISSLACAGVLSGLSQDFQKRIKSIVSTDSTDACTQGTCDELKYSVGFGGALLIAALLWLMGFAFFTPQIKSRVRV